MTRIHDRNQGFTLVELLIVVAIIGILAAIAIPQYTKYKKNAAVANAEASIKNCITELSAAYASNNTASWNCTVGEGTLDLSVSDGEITDASGNYTVSGISGISCSYTASSGKVECN